MTEGTSVSPLPLVRLGHGRGPQFSAAVSLFYVVFACVEESANLLPLLPLPTSVQILLCLLLSGARLRFAAAD